MLNMTSPNPLLIDLFLGIFTSVMGGLLFSIGIILQKKAVIEMPEIKLNNVNSMLEMVKNRTWLLGVGLALIGGIPYIITQALIGVALTQPMILGIQLAFTVLFAIKMLDEKIESKEIFGFILLLSSPVFLALGTVTPPNVNLLSINFLISFLWFIIPTLSLLIFFFIMVKLKKTNDAVVGIAYAVISGIFFAMGAIFMQFGVEIIKGEYFQLFIIGIVFILVMFLGNTTATLIQNLAFQRGKIGIAIAVQSTFSLILAIYGGILIFNQLILFPFFYILGIIIILISNIILIQFQTRIEKIDTELESHE